MKVALVYVCVLGRAESNSMPPEHYWPFEKRFSETYRQFHAGVEHKLFVVGCGAPEEGAECRKAHLFSDIAASYFGYRGTGYDIGAEQACAQLLDYDFTVFMGAQIYFRRESWLNPLVEARQKYGPGLYGPFASYEISPHIRSTCYACDPRLLAEFPHIIKSKAEGHYFESGDWSFSKRVQRLGMATKLVTWDGCYDMPDWRKPPNIFRRGDQSNCLLFDHHCDTYAAASQEERARLEAMADGK